MLSHYGLEGKFCEFHPTRACQSTVWIVCPDDHEEFSYVVRRIPEFYSTPRPFCTERPTGTPYWPARDSLNKRVWVVRGFLLRFSRRWTVEFPAKGTNNSWKNKSPKVRITKGKARSLLTNFGVQRSFQIAWLSPKKRFENQAIDATVALPHELNNSLWWWKRSSSIKNCASKQKTVFPGKPTSFEGNFRKRIHEKSYWSRIRDHKFLRIRIRLCRVNAQTQIDNSGYFLPFNF